MKIETVNGIVDAISTIGELREAISHLKDDNLVVLEATYDNGDVEDLYPFYIDEIDGIELTDKSKVSEVRFCQIHPKKHEDTIQVSWSIQDVIGCAENNEKDVIPNEDQAREILANIDRTRNAEIGINWEVISCHIDMYFDNLNR
jgi:hypothetical protein